MFREHVRDLLRVARPATASEDTEVDLDAESADTILPEGAGQARLKATQAVKLVPFDINLNNVRCTRGACVN